MRRIIEKTPETFVPIGKIADEIVRKIAIKAQQNPTPVPVKRIVVRS